MGETHFTAEEEIPCCKSGLVFESKKYNSKVAELRTMSNESGNNDAVHVDAISTFIDGIHGKALSLKPAFETNKRAYDSREMEEVVSIPPPPPLQPPSSPTSSTVFNQPLNPLAPPFSPTLPWSRALFKLPHIPSFQKLAFSPPLCKGDRIVALCSKDEVERTSETWKDALQGFYADKRPFLPSVIAALERKWEIKETMEVFPRPDGSLIFLFNSLDERKKVLNSGPWFVMGRYLHIRPWSRTIQSRKDFFSSLPVWIHLPNLPLHLWSPGSIGKIASVIGNPLYLDENSANSTKISYARVCVEISADKPAPSSVQVEVEDTEEAFAQPVEYETAFKICSDCKVFGHLAENCAKILTMKPTVRGLKKNSVLARSKNLDNNKQSENLLSGHETDRSWTKVQYKNKARKNQAARVDKSNTGIHDKEKLTGFEHQPENTAAKITSPSKHNRFEPISESLMESLNMEEPVGSPKSSGKLNGTPVTGEDQDGDVVLTEDAIPQNEMGESTLPAAEGDQMNASLEAPRFTFSDMLAGKPFSNFLNQQKSPFFPPEAVTRARFSEADSFFNIPDGIEKSLVIQTEAGIVRLISKNLPIGTDGADCTMELSHVTSPEPPDEMELSILPLTPGPTHVPIPNPLGQAHLDSSLPTLLSTQTINPIPTQSKDCFRPTQTVTSNLSSTFSQAEQPPKFILDLPRMEVSSEESDEDMEFSIPPGCTPDKEDMNDLRNFMKEGVALVPPEHQKEFIASVDLAEDGEILEFFQEKSKAIEDTNYLNFHKVRRSPHLKRKPAKLTDSPSSSGLKRGFLK